MAHVVSDIEFRIRAAVMRANEIIEQSHLFCEKMRESRERAQRMRCMADSRELSENRTEAAADPWFGETRSS